MTSRRIATLMVHTSPLDQAGTGDAGGMNIYVCEAAQNMAAMGVQVDIFTRRTNNEVTDVVEVAPGVRVIQLNVGPVSGVTKELLPKLIPDLSVDVDTIHEKYDIVTNNVLTDVLFLLCHSRQETCALLLKHIHLIVHPQFHIFSQQCKEHAKTN